MKIFYTGDLKVTVNGNQVDLDKGEVMKFEILHENAITPEGKSVTLCSENCTMRVLDCYDGEYCAVGLAEMKIMGIHKLNHILKGPTLVPGEYCPGPGIYRLAKVDSPALTAKEESDD